MISTDRRIQPPFRGRSSGGHWRIRPILLFYKSMACDVNVVATRPTNSSPQFKSLDVKGDHWRHAHGAAMGMYGPDLPILLALSRTTKWDDVGAGVQTIQVISPCLHHLATVWKALSLIVCSSNPVPFGMSKLQFD